MEDDERNVRWDGDIAEIKLDLRARSRVWRLVWVLSFFIYVFGENVSIDFGF